MRVLILGGDGMLGHQLLKCFAPLHETRVTLRLPVGAYSGYRLFDATNAYCGIDLRTVEPLIPVLADFHPELVINAVGIVKQRPLAADTALNLEINALLPHRLMALCKATRARLVQVSTDCVFSGRKGGYRESDLPDAEDLYGRAKLLGEVEAPDCVTLRTSMIGPELVRKAGLVEWFLAQQGHVQGYRNAIFSGFITAELARVIEKIATDFPGARGLYHLSSRPISKFALLTLLKKRLDLPLEIIPNDDYRCDRSLDAAKFQSQFGYRAPDWATMIDELAAQLQGR